MKRVYYILSLFLLAIMIFTIWLWQAKRLASQSNDVATSTPTPVLSSAPSIEPSASPVATPTPTATPLPSDLKLKVPFIAQAPYGVWDALHEEACEEASLLMLYHFKKGDATVDTLAAEREIQSLITYETSHGYAHDVTVDETNRIAADHLGLTGGKVKTFQNSDQIKAELAAGRPVIIPVAGKLLANPNFRNGGPDYHMLIITGYDASGFITNDPGTKRGEGFHYTFDIITKAIHDWDPDNILNGPKTYLVFE